MTNYYDLTSEEERNLDAKLIPWFKQNVDEQKIIDIIDEERRELNYYDFDEYLLEFADDNGITFGGFTEGNYTYNESDIRDKFLEDFGYSVLADIFKIYPLIYENAAIFIGENIDQDWDSYDRYMVRDLNETLNFMNYLAELNDHWGDIDIRDYGVYLDDAPFAEDIDLYRGY